MCTAAAKALRLSDITVSNTQGTPRPEGCYFFKNSQLWMSVNAANKGNGAGDAQDERQPICNLKKEVLPTTIPADTFKKVTSGTCYPILSLSECKIAAVALDISFTRAYDDGQYAAISDPPYCYVENKILKFNQASIMGRGNTGSCSHTDECLCRTGACKLDPCPNCLFTSFQLNCEVMYICVCARTRVCENTIHEPVSMAVCVCVCVCENTHTCMPEPVSMAFCVCVRARALFSSSVYMCVYLWHYS